MGDNVFVLDSPALETAVKLRGGVEYPAKRPGKNSLEAAPVGVSSEDGYNGYFTIKDISKRNEEGEITEYRIAVCDGNTWDSKTEKSGPSYAQVESSTPFEIASKIFVLDKEALNNGVRVFVVPESRWNAQVEAGSSLSANFLYSNEIGVARIVNDKFEIDQWHDTGICKLKGPFGEYYASIKQGDNPTIEVFNGNKTHEDAELYNSATIDTGAGKVKVDVEDFSDDAREGDLWLCLDLDVESPASSAAYFKFMGKGEAIDQPNAIKFALVRKEDKLFKVYRAVTDFKPEFNLELYKPFKLTWVDKNTVYMHRGTVYWSQYSVRVESEEFSVSGREEVYLKLTLGDNPTAVVEHGDKVPEGDNKTVFYKDFGTVDTSNFYLTSANDNIQFTFYVNCAGAHIDAGDKA